MDKKYWYKGVGTITLEDGRNIRTGDSLDGAPEELIAALLTSGKATNKAPVKAASGAASDDAVLKSKLAAMRTDLAERDERITALEAELATVRGELEAANKTVAELTEQLTAPPITPDAPIGPGAQQGKRK